jgi:hypothetical protein
MFHCKPMLDSAQIHRERQLRCSARLAQGDFGRILHTGDARLDERYLALLPEPALAPDLLYLDSTFGEAPLVRAYCIAAWQMRSAPRHYHSTLQSLNSKLVSSHGSDGCFCDRRSHRAARPCGRWWTSFGSTAPIVGSTSGGYLTCGFITLQSLTI